MTGTNYFENVARANFVSPGILEVMVRSIKSESKSYYRWECARG